MNLPPSMNTADLTARLRRYAYYPAHPTPHHVRMETEEPVRQALTLPRSERLHPETLAGIVESIARHRGEDPEKVAAALFGD